MSPNFTTSASANAANTGHQSAESRGPVRCSDVSAISCNLLFKKWNVCEFSVQFCWEKFSAQNVAVRSSGYSSNYQQ